MELFFKVNFGNFKLTGRNWLDSVPEWQAHTCVGAIVILWNS